MLQPALCVPGLRTSPAGLAALQLIMLLIASQAAHSFSIIQQIFPALVGDDLGVFPGLCGEDWYSPLQWPIPDVSICLWFGGLYFSCQTRLIYNFTKFLRLSLLPRTAKDLISLLCSFCHFPGICGENVAVYICHVDVEAMFLRNCYWVHLQKVHVGGCIFCIITFQRMFSTPSHKQ